MQIETLGEILQAQGIRHGAGVPCSYFTPLVNYMTAEPGLDYLPATSEGEAVAVAAGLVAAGSPAFALMQNSGLGNAVNPITSLLFIYRIPVVLLVSHRGEPGRPDEPQHELMGRITDKLARLCDLRTHVLSPEPALFAETLAAAQRDGVPAAWICRKGTLQGGPQAPLLQVRVASGPLSPGSRGTFCAAMTREQALVRILPLISSGAAGDRELPPAVISTTGKLSRELFELDDREHRQRNRFYMVGSMGCAAGFGLGVARGRKERKVVVLDGDGALLMKLGTLVTIGHARPANLHHVVLDNGAHESTGGQPTASPGADLALMALAAGYRLAETTDSEADLAQALQRHLSGDGPTFLRVMIRTGSRKDLGRPTLGPRGVWQRFCAFLQERAENGSAP